MSDQLKNLESLTQGDTVDQVQILADIMYKLTQCIDVRFYGMDSEHELEVQAAELQKSNMLLGGKYILSWISFTFMAYSYWPEARLVQGPGTNGLSDTMWKPQYKDVFWRSKEILQRARIFKANCCLKVHNAHLASPISG